MPVWYWNEMNWRICHGQTIDKQDRRTAMDMPSHRKLPKNCIIETAARTPELGGNSWST